MFGFDKVAAFTHEFETAFDRVRKGEIEPTEDIDRGRARRQGLHPHADRGAGDDRLHHRRRDPRRSASARRYDGSAVPASPHAEDRGASVDAGSEAPSRNAAEAMPTGWQLRLEFDADILRNGSNPLDPARRSARARPLRRRGRLTDDVPTLEELEPEDCFLKWDVTLHSACDRAAIDDVFMFVRDEMKLTVTPIVGGEAPTPVPSLPAERSRRKRTGEIAQTPVAQPAPAQPTPARSLPVQRRRRQEAG